MSDFNRQQPIHPADCPCPRCDPQLLSGRRRLMLEHYLIALILTATFVGAGLVIFGAIPGPTN